jgi:hypothetical protein
VHAPRSMYCGRHALVLHLPVRFKRELPADAVALAVRRLTATLQACHGELQHLTIEPVV